MIYKEAIEVNNGGGGVDQYKAGISSYDLRANERPGPDHVT